MDVKFERYSVIASIFDAAAVALCHCEGTMVDKLFGNYNTRTYFLNRQSELLYSFMIIFLR